MATEVIVALFTLGGVLLGVFGKSIAAYFSSSTDDKMNLRDSMLKRISQLEERQAEQDKRQARLEKTVQVWITRYWSLYRWIINFSMTHKLDITPPNFHEMESPEVKETIKDMYQDSGINKEKNDES